MSEALSVPFFEINAMVRLGQRTELESFLRQFSAAIAARPEQELELAQSQAIFVLTAVVNSLLELGADERYETAIASQSSKFLQCGSMAELSEAVSSCFVQMLRCTAPKSNRYAQQIIDQALSFINEEFSHQISDEEMASRLHLSRSHFRYLFKAVTGVPLGRYLTELRLVEARKLLESSGLSVKEVCRKVGYSEVSGFCRAYRAYHGVAPSHHRTGKIELG